MTTVCGLSAFGLSMRPIHKDGLFGRPKTRKRQPAHMMCRTASTVHSTTPTPPPPLFKGSRMPPLPANQTSPSKLKTEICACGGGGGGCQPPAPRVMMPVGGQFQNGDIITVVNPTPLLVPRGGHCRSEISGVLGGGIIWVGSRSRAVCCVLQSLWPPAKRLKQATVAAFFQPRDGASSSSSSSSC